MSFQSPANQRIVKRAWLRLLAMAALVLIELPACAQTRDGSDASSLSDRVNRQGLAAMLQTPGALDFIDLSAGPGQRPRGALRFRFEGATRTLRGMGVDADECRTLVRSTSNRATTAMGTSDGVRLGLAVTLNCSFF